MMLQSRLKSLLATTILILLHWTSRHYQLGWPFRSPSVLFMYIKMPKKMYSSFSPPEGQAEASTADKEAGKPPESSDGTASP